MLCLTKKEKTIVNTKITIIILIIIILSNYKQLSDSTNTDT